MTLNGFGWLQPGGNKLVAVAIHKKAEPADPAFSRPLIITYSNSETCRLVWLLPVDDDLQLPHAEHKLLKILKSEQIILTTMIVLLSL